MPELSPAEVGALATAVGLRLDDPDRAEIAHRLNAFLEVLAALASLDLSDAEPSPVPAPTPAPTESIGQ